MMMNVLTLDDRVENLKLKKELVLACNWMTSFGGKEPNSSKMTRRPNFSTKWQTAKDNLMPFKILR